MEVIRAAYIPETHVVTEHAWAYFVRPGPCFIIEELHKEPLKNLRALEKWLKKQHRVSLYKQQNFTTDNYTY